MADEYPSNSRVGKSKAEPAAPFTASKSPDKKVERVTTGEVVRRKPSLGKRFKKFMIGMDARQAIGYVMSDVLAPAIRNMIVDGATELVEKTIFGESRRRGSGWRPGNSSYNPYNRYAQTAPVNQPPWQRPDPRRDLSRRARSVHDFDEIVLETRGEAEEVIDQLNAIIEQYSAASVADLYAMVGVTSEFTDRKYGWTNLQGANAQRDRGGRFVLNLPRPEILE